MSSIFDRDDQYFEVVVNDQGQYSIWPKDWRIPVGWKAIGISGFRPACMGHIEAIWIDMRPRSAVERVAGDSI